MTELIFTKKHLDDFEKLIRKYIHPNSPSEANRVFNEICKAYNEIYQPRVPHFKLPTDQSRFEIPPTENDL